MLKKNGENITSSLKFQDAVLLLLLPILLSVAAAWGCGCGGGIVKQLISRKSQICWHSEQHNIVTSTRL